MNNFLIDTAKSVQSYANLLSAVVFMQNYIKDGSMNSFLLSFYGLMMLYLLSYVLYSMGLKEEESKNDR